MKRDLLFVAIVSTAATSTACYDPTLGRCTVRCQGDEPCPDNLTCASDNFCHASSNDPPNCNSQGSDGGVGSNMVTLTVMPTGSGTGTITSPSPVLQCSSSDVGGPTCTATVKVDTVVTLTEAADASSVFDSWGDGASACSGQICMLTLKDSTTVTAQFDAAARLVIDMLGQGDGAVTSTPAGLISTLDGMSCNDEGSDDTEQCSGSFAIGTNITLIASPNGIDGSVFNSWVEESQPVPCADPDSTTCTFQVQANVEFGVQFDQD
jgi:hypothetical protein